MSKTLDNILTDLGASLFCAGQDYTPGDGSASDVDSSCDSAKADIKAFFKELVGEEESTVGAQNEAGHISLEDYERNTRNNFKAELRKKIADL